MGVGIGMTGEGFTELIDEFEGEVSDTKMDVRYHGSETRGMVGRKKCFLEKQLCD